MKTEKVFNEACSQTRLPEGVSVQPRKPDVEGLKDLPKFWFGGNPAVTVGSNVFSIFIPPGERFFIRSVRHYKDRIKDPELKELVRAFMQQETLHGKAHDVYNDSFAQHGLDVDDERRRAEKLFNRMEKYLPAKMRLGFTVFAEHITAVGAAGAFYDENFVNWSDPRATAFWQWHAAEELEHKAVAFDVLKMMGGGYFTRVFSALLGLIIMAVPLYRAYMRVYRAYGGKLEKEHRKQLAIMQHSKAMKIQRKQILEYFIPGFHPWKIDDSELLRQWKDENDLESGLAPQT